MDIHHQIVDFLKLTRRLSEQAGDRLLTFLIDMAIEQSTTESEQPGLSRSTAKVPPRPF